MSGQTTLGSAARKQKTPSSPRNRCALETAELTGPRWGLMLFGAEQSQLDRVKAHMPLIKQLTLNVSRDFYWSEAAQRADSSGYVGWATGEIHRAMRAGFDVLALLTGGAGDLDETLVQRATDIARVLKKNEVPVAAGRLSGFCFDLEWENSSFSHNGWKGYVDSVANALIELESQYPEVNRFGPGGTHSDDATLPDLLTRLEQLGAFFTHVTYHAYSDKGWAKWEKRAKALKRLFSDFGYDTVSITECGVTGEDRWGDSRRGVSEELFHVRWANDLKPRLDDMPHVLLRQIYQITEAGDVEEHGQDFGMFFETMAPKSATRLWQ